MSNIEARNFCTVYLSKYFSQKMSIPPNGIVFRNQLMSATAILRNCNRQCWQVEVNNCAGKMCFDKAWGKFINENKIEEKDVLVFINQAGSLVFDVTAFGADGCPKIVSPLVSDQEQEVEFVDLVEDDDDEEEEEEEQQEDEDLVEDDEEEELEEEQQEDEEWNDEGTTSMEVEDEELDIGRYINHLNPYFVVKKIPKIRVNELHVPKNVIRAYQLSMEDKEEITFIGLHNQKTIGKVSKRKNGQTKIIGWKHFCYKNIVNLQFHICIFEFLRQVEQDDAGQRTKKIKVHIIRRKHTPMA